MTHHWDDLPQELRTVVSKQFGYVLSAMPAPCGTGSDIVTTLHTSTGSIFLKGFRLDGSRADLRRIEQRVQPYLPSLAPKVLWEAEVGGWLLLAFEYIKGRHADLAPGSGDLPVVARTLAELAGVTQPALPVLPIEQRWAPFGDAESLALLHGDTLVHTDLTSENILVGDRVRVVDWAWPTRGAPWLDTAFVITRLIHAGHTPVQAEEWAEQVPVWRSATTEAIAGFITSRIALVRRQRHRHLEHALTRWQEHRSPSV